MIIVVGVCDSHKLSIKSFQIFVNDQGDCQIGNIATIYIDQLVQRCELSG